MTSPTTGPVDRGLVLQPFRAARPSADGDRLARLLCPPYDVIDPAQRAALISGDRDNAVAIVLPESENGQDRYEVAAHLLDEWVSTGHFMIDAEPAHYVYEMRDAQGSTTRGLVGAVELRDPADSVILPHENTMAGPVADRLALLSATEADVEPIYLVYDGGGAASQAVSTVRDRDRLVRATTPDGISHTLWALTDRSTQTAIADDLADRRALIADGHHRYATYRELQTRLNASRGPGPWDFGLALLVDSSSHGPQVHAIHRVLHGFDLQRALDTAPSWELGIRDVGSPADGLASLDDEPGFAAVLSDGRRSVVVTDPQGRVRAASVRQGEPPALADLDVSVLHRGLVEAVWALEDSVETVGYAHSVEEALGAARSSAGTAVLLRPTPIAAVAAVAAAGARMPRKSTLFTPKPASGLIMRRFADADCAVRS